MEQIANCLSNIASSSIGKCGIFFNEAMARYVIDKFQTLVDNLESVRDQKRRGDQLSSTMESTTDKALMVIGLLFQSFQHCHNGQQTGMTTIFSLLMNFADTRINNADFSSLSACICSIISHKIALDIFQFKDKNNRDHNESASFFARSMNMMGGQYGLHAAEAGSWFDDQQLPLLHNHLVRNHPDIIQKLSPQTQRILAKRRANVDEIRAAVRNIFAVAMNMYFVNTLLQSEYGELRKQLIQAYAKATGRIPQNWIPSSPEVSRQLLEEILYKQALLEHSTH
jgi:hypothetical protein